VPASACSWSRRRAARRAARGFERRAVQGYLVAAEQQQQQRRGRQRRPPGGAGAAACGVMWPKQEGAKDGDEEDIARSSGKADCKGADAAGDSAEPAARSSRAQRRVAGWGGSWGQLLSWSHLWSGERETGVTPPAKLIHGYGRASIYPRCSSRFCRGRSHCCRAAASQSAQRSPDRRWRAA